MIGRAGRAERIALHGTRLADAGARARDGSRQRSQEIGMPKAKWTDKRERQYEHIKGSLEQRGENEAMAERIAAATVNKDRARSGESETASESSLRGPSPERRGGLHSHTGAAGRTRDELYREAIKRGVKGRSKMTKAQLEAAVGP